MHQSIQSFKSPSPTGHPPRIWTIEDRFAEPFTSWGQNHVHMLNVRTRFDGQFYYFIVKGKISDRGFLTIDQSLKPGLWRSFPQNHSFELFTFITSISPYLKIYYLNSAGITWHFWFKFPTPARQVSNSPPLGTGGEKGQAKIDWRIMSLSIICTFKTDEEG